mmetsp:Transcript_4703/g.13612  ORF Transcript_4703/g.13612 Transcript_4703/m.13612 type:complete len:263 (-) Transcript_4703:281-1069(-)
MMITDKPEPLIKNQGRGRSNSLPTHVAEYLKTWLMNHMHHPYPTDQEKQEMCQKTGIDVKRLNNWFVNNRIRYWKPRMEAMQRQQQQQQKLAQQANPSILVGPYSRLISSGLSASLLPSMALLSTGKNNDTIITPYLQQASTATSSLPRKMNNNTPATNTSASTSPSVVSDVCSVDEEGDWSDGGSVRSAEGFKRTTTKKVTPSPTSRKRCRNEEEEEYPKPSKATKTLDSCNTSSPATTAVLPTLDEAALLFGFAKSQATR